jgi:integrase
MIWRALIRQVRVRERRRWRLYNRTTHAREQRLLPDPHAGGIAKWRGWRKGTASIAPENGKVAQTYLYPRSEDWVFASPANDGQLPYWPGSLYRTYLEPAAKAAGIPGKIGWHTFRHSFATLLKANGEDIKTAQELLRHANISVTMNIYAQGVTELKRNAQHRIVRMVTGGKDEEAEETA